MSRSSNYRRQHESDETFTRAAWETARDTEIAYDCRIDWKLGLDTQRGVWRVSATVWSTRNGESSRQLARAQGDFPNSRAGSFSAYIFTIANTLAMQVDSVREEDTRTRN